MELVQLKRLDLGILVVVKAPLSKTVICAIQTFLNCGPIVVKETQTTKSNDRRKSEVTANANIECMH